MIIAIMMVIIIIMSIIMTIVIMPPIRIIVIVTPEWIIPRTVIAPSPTRIIKTTAPRYAHIPRAINVPRSVSRRITPIIILIINIIVRSYVYVASVYIQTI
jgi:hypothetical protein